jgi:hypothetical protein
MSKHRQATLEATAEPPVNSAGNRVLKRPGVTEHGANAEPGSAPQGFITLTFSPDSLPPQEPRPNGDSGPLDFSRLAVRESTRIADDDASRVQLTRWLLHELAPLLGLDPNRIEIRVNGEAEGRTNAHGASGVMEAGTIYLHPKLYRPEAEDGRCLLAHETTHVAQLRAPIAGPISAAHAVEEAEREADEVAAAFVRNLPVRPPRQRIPAGRAMAKEAAPKSDPPSHASLVAQNRTAEIAEIQSRLSYGIFDWKITDADITAVLRQLESLDFLTITAIAELLTSKNRARFADNLDAIHFNAFRSTVLAFYLGIAHKGEISVLPEDPFPGMAWSGLSDAEHYAMYEILTVFLATKRGRQWQLKLPQKTYDHTQDVLKEKPRFNVDEEREKARKNEEKVATEREQAAAAMRAKDVGDFLKQAKDKLSYGFTDWAVRDHEALAVLDGMADFASDPAKLRAIISELEREGLMDRLVDNLPVDALYTDVGEKTGSGRINRRRAFLQVVALRPPAKNAAMVEDLLSRGFFDWAITDEDAYLALQLLKALPARSRESLFALEGGKYAKRLDQELSLSMKQGKNANFYQGGEGGRDLQAIKSQLADDGLWSLEQIGRLRMLIQMAIAAGEGDWVFEQSRDRYKLYQAFRQLYENKEFFGRIVEGFKLYKPKGLRRPDGSIDSGRTEYVAEVVTGKPFGTDNIFWQYFIQGLDFIFESGNVELMGESIGGEELDFGEFQDLTGGSFLGAEFKREEQVSKQAAKELADNSVRWDLDQGVLQLRAARFEIANIHYPLANLKFQTGSGTVIGLHLHLQYPTEKSEHHSTTLQLRVDSLLLNDVLLIFADSMVGLQSVLVEGLTLELRPENVREAFGNPHGGMAVTIPILGPLVSPIVNLIKLSGSIDTLVKGLLEPESIEDVTMTSQNLVLKGLTTSGGQYVEDISLGPLNLRTRYARSLEFYVRGLKEEKIRLEKRLDTVRKTAAKKGPRPRYYLDLDTEPSLKLQLESVDRELTYIEEAQAERTRLTELKDKGQISPADEHKLWKVSKYLDGLAKGGVALDVASTKVAGLKGKVSAEEVEVGELHGYGQSAGATLGFLFSSTTMNRMLRGRDYRGTVPGIDEEGEPQFFLETNKIAFKELAVETTVPTVAEANKALQKAEELLAQTPNDASLIAKRNRALVLRDAAVTYWVILEKPGGLIVGPERDKLNRAREELTKDRAFFAKLLTLDDAALELGQGPRGGERVGLTAAALHGETLEAGGVTVGAIDGKNVMIGAESRGGLSALIKDWRKELKSGQLAADSLVATNIVHAGSGATVDRVALTTVGANLEVDGQGKIGVQATKIEVTGVSIVATRRLLEAEKEFLLMVPVEARHEADDKKITAIDESLKELDAYEDAERLCQTALDEAKKSGDPKDTAKAEQDLEFAKFSKLEWQRRLLLRGLSIDQLNISVLGLGNVLDEDFDPKAAISHGFEVRGGGKGGRWLDAARLTGSRIPGLSGDEVVLGPMGGKLKHSQEQTVLDDFFIESVEATGLEFHAPPHHLSSGGTSTLTRLRGSATFIREKRPDKNGFETWQLASVMVPTFNIEKIEGDNLSYAFSTLDDFFDLEIESGSIGNVWVDNLQVDFKPDDQVELHGIDPEKPGGAGIDQVNDLKLVGFLGEKIKAGGLLNGKGIKAEFITARKQKFTIDELTATKGQFSKEGLADLGFTVRKLGLAVTRDITDTGDVSNIEKIKIPAITLTTGSTITKGGIKVELLGKADLVGTNLSAKVVRTKQRNEYKVTSAVINDLIISDVSADKIRIRIAGKPADASKGTKESPPIDVVVPNATIKDLHVWGFDLLNMTGSFETTSVSVTDVAVEIAKKGEAAFKKIGLSVRSDGLAGTLMGPNRLFLDLGNLELSGSFEGAGVNLKKFSLEKIGGFVDIGPDYVRIFDLNTGPLNVGPVVYKDADGNQLDLASIKCPAVHLSDLHAKWTTDTTTKEEKVSELTFSGLVFDKVEATGFKYTGKFTSENEKKQKVESNLKLEAVSATFEPLVIDTFTYDALKALISVDPKIKDANISQFQANLTQYLDGKFTQKVKVVTDVTAKEMRASLKFNQIKSAAGDSWKFSSGTFHLDSFGLKHPDVKYMGYDEKGKLQEWTVKQLPDAADPGFVVTGVNVTVLPDGTIFLNFDELVATGLRAKQVGGPTIDIPIAELKTAAVAMQRETPDRAFEILGATLKKIEVKGVKVELEVDRNAPSSGGKSTELWSLDALSALEGDLALHFKDAKYYVDADVNCPIRGGVIDFDNVNLEHIGPNSAMGIDPKGIYVDGLGTVLARSYIYERNSIEGATFEEWEFSEPTGVDDPGSSRVTSRGSLNLRRFLEQMLNDPKAASGKAPEQLEDLNRMNLTGRLTLGDDALGKRNNSVTLSGKSAGKNAITINAVNLGKNLEITMPEFQASKAKFEVLGKAGETGLITAKLKLEVTGLGNAPNARGHLTFTVTLTVEEGHVNEVKWGDVAKVEATAKRVKEEAEAAKKATTEKPKEAVKTAGGK